MDDAGTRVEARQRYQDALQAAMGHAGRFVAYDQAFEIAHEVASELLRRVIARPDAFPNQRTIDVFVRRSAMNRVRNFWRAAGRREATAQQYHDERSDVAPAWAVPGSTIEIRELRAVIDRTIAEMPATMRRVFLLIREHDLPYKEVAEQLGIATGTVHTHLSRAMQRLHRAVDRHRAGESGDSSTDLPRTNMRIVS